MDLAAGMMARNKMLRSTMLGSFVEACLFGAFLALTMFIVLDGTSAAMWCLRRIGRGLPGACIEDFGSAASKWIAAWSGFSVFLLAFGGIAAFLWCSASLLNALRGAERSPAAWPGRVTTRQIVLVGGLSGLLVMVLLAAREWMRWPFFADGPVVVAGFFAGAAIELFAALFNAVAGLFLEPQSIVRGFDRVGRAMALFLFAYGPALLGLFLGFVYARWIRPAVLRRWPWLIEAQRPANGP